MKDDFLTGLSYALPFALLFWSVILVIAILIFSSFPVLVVDHADLSAAGVLS